MIEFVSPHEIKPAEYNPRKIDDKDFEKLCESLKTLGIIVPIIVNRKNNVIIAGHQRQKAAKSIGLDKVPVMYAENVSLTDEVVFNQIHNGSDFDQGLVSYIKPQNFTGWGQIPIEDNTCECGKAEIVNQVCKLIERYGNVLSCVSSQSGEVFKATAYARACKLLGIPANVYVVDDGLLSFTKKAFSKTYGVFSYEHLEKNTWVQGLAQVRRNREKTTSNPHKKARSYKSRLYEQLVIPNITRDMRGLDFGAGKEQYAQLLNADGFKISTLEFYHNNRKGVNINRTNREIDTVISDVKNKGLYDFIVLDSVLNSVDSVEAERSVMGTCNALLKTGGILFFSGRTKKSALSYDRAKKISSDKNSIYFLDKDGFSATFREGNFFYQKFHDDDQIRKIISDHGFSLIKFKSDGSAWRCMVKKEDQSPYCKSGVEFEFNLPYPGGRYGRHNDVLEVLKDYIS